MRYLKPTLTLLASVISVVIFAQKIDFNMDDGYIANGYDVVSYFDKKPTEGNSKFVCKYKGAILRFSSQSNLNKFKANPGKYMPQYGGWCAYAMGAKNKKVKMDPETYEIRNGKLYLFYNSFFNNTYKSWLEEDPGKLIKKANKHWEVLKYED